MQDHNKEVTHQSDSATKYRAAPVPRKIVVDPLAMVSAIAVVGFGHNKRVKRTRSGVTNISTRGDEFGDYLRTALSPGLVKLSLTGVPLITVFLLHF